MRVFFLPWNRKNPYQSNLARALGEHGVEVTFCRTRRVLPVLSLLWRHGMPDVLHLHWVSGFIVSRYRWASYLTSGLLLAELMVFRVLGVRIVWTIHNLVEHKKRDVPFELHVARRVAALCHGMIVHSRRCRDVAADALRVRDPATRMIVVPHGHYLDNYPDEVDQVAARKRLGIGAESFVYLFFGMIRPYKGIEDLVEAFRSLEDANAILQIVGACRDANLAVQIERAAVEDRRVHPVLHHVEPEEIQYYMRAADAVVLPFSDVFTSGSAVLAMGFGKALVVPRLGSLPDYVDPPGGVLYDAGEGSLLEALREIRRADWRAMGVHNRERARELDWGVAAAATFGAYQGIRRTLPEPPGRRGGEATRVDGSMLAPTASEE